jgi:hypothetical protein
MAAIHDIHCHSNWLAAYAVVLSGSEHVLLDCVCATTAVLAGNITRTLCMYCNLFKIYQLAAVVKGSLASSSVHPLLPATRHLVLTWRHPCTAL